MLSLCAIGSTCGSAVADGVANNANQLGCTKLIQAFAGKLLACFPVPAQQWSLGVSLSLYNSKGTGTSSVAWHGRKSPNLMLLRLGYKHTAEVRVHEYSQAHQLQL